MSTRTDNLQFIKPELSDAANITTYNENWDKLDGTLKRIDDELQEVKQSPEVSSAKSYSDFLRTDYWQLGSDERYYLELAVEGVTSETAIVLVDVNLSNTSVSAKETYLEAWALVSVHEVTQGSGFLRFYATEKPSVSIPVYVGVL